MIIAIATTIVLSASAMSLSRARSEALFLSDKMAYVLNLTDDQYNAVYEINLDYILQVSNEDDVFGTYWQERNANLRYVLTSSQYTAYLSMEYFYRPISWVSNRLVYIIHNKYPKNRYYRSAPRNYSTYNGGNRNYSHSVYQGRTYSDNHNAQPRQQVSQQPTMRRTEAIKQANRQTQQNGTSSRSNGNGTSQSKSQQGNSSQKRSSAHR